MIFKISKEHDIKLAMSKANKEFKKLGLKDADVVELTTIVSELGYNIIKYTPRGNISISSSDRNITVVATDNGKGIENLTHAVCEGYSSSGTLGLGLNGIVRLSDDFEINTSSNGTTITVQKRIK